MPVKEVKRESLGWGKTDIEQVAQVSPADIERAGAMWRSNAPKEAKDILDARTEE